MLNVKKFLEPNPSFMPPLSTPKTIVYKDQGLLPPVKSELFTALDIRFGTIAVAEINAKARVPSMRIVMEFGPNFDDLKQASAQLQDNYYEDTSAQSGNAADGRPKTKLQGLQIAAVTNLPKRNVGIPSFFLTLGVVSLEGENTGTVALNPSVPCPNGARLKLLNDTESSYGVERIALTDYATTFHHLDIRLATVISLTDKLVDFGPGIGLYHFSGDYPLLKEDMQILRIINLSDLSEKDNFLGVVDLEGRKIPVTLERPLANGRFLK